MHIRRIASQLADLFSRHGHKAEVEATVTGRTRTSYRLPLVVRPAGSVPVLVDGDLEAAAVDDGAVLRLYLAAVDVGAKALYVHAGAATAAAHEAGGDRVLLWAKDDIVLLLGLTQWNEALGLPLPSLPIAAASTTASPVPVALPLAPTPMAVDVAAPAEPLEAPLPSLPVPEPAAAVVEVAEVPDVAHVPDVALAPVDLPIPEALTPGAYIDLDVAPTEPAMDLETGEAVEVTSLPKDAADELATAEPLQVAELAEPVDAAEPAVATGPVPTWIAEVLPVAFKVPKQPAETLAGAESVAEPAAPTEPPLFQLPPAFREPGGAGGSGGVALPVPEGSNGLLPGGVTLDEARALVADRLFGIEEWELILQPVHLFDYAVEVLREGSLEMDVQRGRLQVNGTDRKVTVTDPLASDPSVPSRVQATPDLTIMDKVLRVSPERAEQVARAWASETYGKTVDVPMAGADDSFDLTERRTIGPTSGQVTLDALGVWHRPFWRLWGSNGHVDLDAVEGHVLDEEIKSPNPDFLVVE